MAPLFLLFTGLLVAGLVAAMVRYLDGRRRSIALVVLAAWLLYATWLGYSGVLASPIARFRKAATFGPPPHCASSHPPGRNVRRNSRNNRS